MFDSKVICAVVFHCLTALFVWSYAMVIFTPPGFAPSSWHLSPDQVNSFVVVETLNFQLSILVECSKWVWQVDKLRSAQSEEEWKAMLFTLAEQLSCRVKQRSVQNAVRYCEKCLAIKPDRFLHWLDSVRSSLPNHVSQCFNNQHFLLFHPSQRHTPLNSQSLSIATTSHKSNQAIIEQTMHFIAMQKWW